MTTERQVMGDTPRHGFAYARLLADILRAEAAGQDLQEGPRGVHVYAMREDRTRYELGWVSLDAALRDPDGARAAIQRIKFARSLA